ncbi:MAG TPA: response regulator [Bauldia sp.]|nr:response regulator [Bauldia sp.]
MVRGVAAAPGAFAAGELVTRDGRRPEVAIVGGSPSSTLVATVLCQQFGCSTVPAPSGESALALLRGETRVDLVLIDLSVADMDGIVAVQLIRALGSRGTLPIVALTANPADATSSRTRIAGFSSVLIKPYSPRELHAALHGALARAAAARPA